MAWDRDVNIKTPAEVALYATKPDGQRLAFGVSKGLLQPGVTTADLNAGC